MISTNEWREIELRARDAAIADLLAIEATPLVPGEHIAWTRTTDLGKMDGFSSVHRIGQPGADEVPRTVCGQVIPPPIRRVHLAPRWRWVLDRCGACEFGEADEGPDAASVATGDHHEDT